MLSVLVDPGKMSGPGSSISVNSGSVARKIALFQYEAQSNTGTQRLRRKEVIRRKKPPPSTASVDSDTQSSCAESTISSPASSDSCYATGSSVDEVHRCGLALPTYDARIRSSRPLKDCYQSFTLPSRPGRRPCFQLVEFSEFSDLDSVRNLESFYEELDSPDLTSVDTVPSHEALVPSSTSVTGK